MTKRFTMPRWVRVSLAVAAMSAIWLVGSALEAQQATGKPPGGMSDQVF